MRVLLTGAAGFIGSHLCDRLLADGADVLGVDNLLTGRRENIEHLQTNARFCLLEHDAITPFDVGGSVDWILHFASPASPPKYLARPTETLRVNSEGTYHLLELARRNRAKFFLASTSEVYGDPAVHPQVESYWGNVNPIGPRVTNFITQALAGCPLTVYGSGTQTRSLQYVDDLVEGVLRLMDIEWTTPVNLGNPEEYTMTELASLVIKLTGSRSTIVREPLPVDDPKRRRPDITVARDVLGWEPRVSMRQGLTRTIAHYRERLSAAVCP